MVTPKRSALSQSIQHILYGLDYGFAAVVRHFISHICVDDNASSCISTHVSPG